MALPRGPALSPLLLERRYWQERMSHMGTVGRGLLMLPRTDLTGPIADVVEWRIRAHDGLRLWGLRGTSHFHPEPTSARVRSVEATELPEIAVDDLAEGRAEFVYQTPAGRRLEDRVLDLLRVVSMVVSAYGLDPTSIQLGDLGRGLSERPPDEYAIVERLIREGILNA